MLRADRLKSEIWVSAQIRLCNARGVPLVVSRKGDPDAGAVILKLLGADGRVAVYTQARTPEGDLAWVKGTGTEPVVEAEADAYISRQVKRDPDIWVVEIEDRDGSYAAGLPML